MADRLYPSVLRALLQKPVWSGVRHVVAEDVILETNTRLLVAQIGKCHNGNADRDVTPHDLRCAVEASHKGDLAADLLVYVQEIADAEPAPAHVVRELLARELLDQAAQAIIDARNSGSVDVESPNALVQRAREIVVADDAIPTLSLGDAVLPAVGSERGRVISLGVSKKLDRVFDGGIGLGEVFIYVAAPNRGKTTFLCASGADAVAAGNNVLHVILGDSGPGKVLRLYERRALRSSKHGWTDAKSAEARAVLAANGGRLAIKDMRGIDTTLDVLEGVIVAHERTTNAPVDLVVLDYLELMAYGRGERRGQEIRHHYGYIGRQTKRMASARHTRILTAWQVNREGSDADTTLSKHLSESWDIFKHVDGGVALDWSASEKRAKRMRLTILKQREDDEAPRTVNIYCDYSHMRMEDELDAVHKAGGPEQLVPGVDTARLVPGARLPESGGAVVRDNESDHSVPAEEGSAL